MSKKRVVTVDSTSLSVKTKTDTDLAESENAEHAEKILEIIDMSIMSEAISEESKKPRSVEKVSTPITISDTTPGKKSPDSILIISPEKPDLDLIITEDQLMATDESLSQDILDSFIDFESLTLNPPYLNVPKSIYQYELPLLNRLPLELLHPQCR